MVEYSNLHQSKCVVPFSDYFVELSYESFATSFLEWLTTYHLQQVKLHEGTSCVFYVCGGKRGGRDRSLADITTYAPLMAVHEENLLIHKDNRSNEHILQSPSGN